jgi:hypothetical protein
MTETYDEGQRVCSAAGIVAENFGLRAGEIDVVYP